MEKEWKGNQADPQNCAKWNFSSVAYQDKKELNGYNKAKSLSKQFLSWLAGQVNEILCIV